jgi:hypothetical protein
MFNTYNNLDRLNRRAAERRHQIPAGSDKVAAINMLRKMGPELARMSQMRETLPRSVSEEAYPGGVLPPGDVVKVEHYTAAPEFQAFDPSLWNSRSASPVSNAEAGRFMSNPDIRSSQFYLPDLGSVPETQITGQPGQVRKIEGYVPGMYNLDRDPDNLGDYVREQFARENPGAGGFPDAETQNMLAREAARRGYAGTYNEIPAPEATYKYRLDVTTPVDLTGAAPNIPAMRTQLGLKVGAHRGEGLMDPQATAQVTTETQPGVGVMPERYALYKDNPTASHMLHRDYEQLLRNPDGSSVVGNMLGVEPTEHRQSVGVYEGQRNPMVQQRVTVTPPRVDASADPKTIKEQAQLSPEDQAKMNALAAVEGKIRGQDAAAWGYPIHMTEESAMPLAGLPWENVDGAIFRSPTLGKSAVESVADEVLSIPVPAKYKANTMEDLIAVTPAPDGGGGVMLLNIGMDNGEFQSMVRIIRGNHPVWESQNGMTTEWGTYDGNYITDYDAEIAKLPRDLRQKAEQAVETLQPMANQIGSYHDQLRKPPEAPKKTPEQQEEERRLKSMTQLLKERGQF